MGNQHQPVAEDFVFYVTEVEDKGLAYRNQTKKEVSVKWKAA